MSNKTLGGSPKRAAGSSTSRWTIRWVLAHEPIAVLSRRREFAAIVGRSRAAR